MGCSSSIPMSENVIDEIKDSERMHFKDKYNKVLLLDKSTHGTDKADKADKADKTDKTDTNIETKDQVTMWG